MNEDVRGEAARLQRRLGVASDHLVAILDGVGEGATGVRSGVARGGVARGGVARGGVARIDDDDEVRTLLRPAADRITRLLELTGALADGTLSETSAGDAARAVADTQPYRRPR